MTMQRGMYSHATMTAVLPPQRGQSSTAFVLDLGPSAASIPTEVRGSIRVAIIGATGYVGGELDPAARAATRT